VNVQPEYDDVAAAAAALGRPMKVVLAEAIARASAFWTE
jgi:pyridinium-3,5-bisthiocarboxylic acid mononucleotide nickel chelatase